MGLQELANAAKKARDLNMFASMLCDENEAEMLLVAALLYKKLTMDARYRDPGLIATVEQAVSEVEGVFEKVYKEKAEEKKND